MGSGCHHLQLKAPQSDVVFLIAASPIQSLAFLALSVGATVEEPTCLERPVDCGQLIV